MYYMVASLRNFEGINLNQGYEVSVDEENSYLITKRHPDITKIITNNNYISYIGSANFQELASNYFAIKVFNSNTMNDDVKYTLLSNSMQYLETFCLALWFVKDNAVTPTLSTMSSDAPGESNGLLRRNIIISNAQGLAKTVSFDTLELNAALIWYNKIIDISSKNTVVLVKQHKDMTT